MLKRYTLPEMRQLWLRPETKFETWLKVELAFLHARCEAGDFTGNVYEAIAKYAKVNVDRINELESEYQHDLIAFVVSIQESLEAAGVGQYKEEFHSRLTSYDVEDPALITMLRGATMLVIEELRRLENALLNKVKEHKWTLMIGRTHGQFAEPDTFGCLLLVYVRAIERSIKRLVIILQDELGEGKMSGAIGTYAGINPELEKKALGVLGLKPALAETQILQRDRHAILVAALAVAAGSIEQMCRTFWEMMRSDVGELREPRTERQRGSSAMAHKRNPIITERLIGMARMVRACAGATMENIATPEGRDISQSNVEREIFPTATSLVHYMAHKAAWLVENLEVFPERMKKNLEATKGTWATQRVRIALMDEGVSYNDAYNYTQAVAFKAIEEEKEFSDLISKEPISERDARDAESVLGHGQFETCFDVMSYIHDGIDYIFRQNGIQ